MPDRFLPAEGTPAIVESLGNKAEKEGKEYERQSQKSNLEAET